jgi:preprotein translocase subunit SecF
MNLPNIYESKHYKKLLVIPLILIVISLIFIPSIPKGVDLKGGSLFIIYTDEASDKLSEKRATLEGNLGKFSSDVAVRLFENPSGRGLEIEVGTSGILDEAEKQLSDLEKADAGLAIEISKLAFMQTNEQDKAKIDAQSKIVDAKKAEQIAGANSLLGKIGSAKTVTDSANSMQVVEEEYQNIVSRNREAVLAEIRNIISIKSYSSKEIGASLSRYFLSKTAEIILLSLLFAAIFVILLIRDKIASLAILFGTFADIVITAGIMGLLGIPISLATLATLLMLIGFAIDTNMLLTIRAFKRTEGVAKERIYDAMRTAITMNVAGIAAFGVLLSISIIFQIETYYQIGAVAMIGGLVDIIATWCGNAVLVLWFTEVRQRG